MQIGSKKYLQAYDLPNINTTAITNHSGTPTDLPKLQLRIIEPRTIGILATSRIAVREGSSEVRVFANAQWLTNLPALIQDRLMQSLESLALQKNSNFVVVSDSSDLEANLLLITTIRKFEYQPLQNACFVEISGQIATSDGKVVASKVFYGNTRLTNRESVAVANGLGLAFKSVTEDVVRWVNSAIAKH